MKFGFFISLLILKTFSSYGEHISQYCDLAFCYLNTQELELFESVIKKIEKFFIESKNLLSENSKIKTQIALGKFFEILGFYSKSLNMYKKMEVNEFNSDLNYVVQAQILRLSQFLGLSKRERKNIYLQLSTYVSEKSNVSLEIEHALILFEINEKGWDTGFQRFILLLNQNNISLSDRIFIFFEIINEYLNYEIDSEIKHSYSENSRLDHKRNNKNVFHVRLNDINFLEIKKAIIDQSIKFNLDGLKSKFNLFELTLFRMFFESKIIEAEELKFLKSNLDRDAFIRILQKSKYLDFAQKKLIQNKTTTLQSNSYEELIENTLSALDIRTQKIIEKKFVSLNLDKIKIYYSYDSDEILVNGRIIGLTQQNLTRLFLKNFIINSHHNKPNSNRVILTEYILKALYKVDWSEESFDKLKKLIFRCNQKISKECNISKLFNVNKNEISLNPKMEIVLKKKAS